MGFEILTLKADCPVCSKEVAIHKKHTERNTWIIKAYCKVRNGGCGNKFNIFMKYFGRVV